MKFIVDWGVHSPRLDLLLAAKIAATGPRPTS